MAGKAAFGVALQRGDGGVPEVFTAIGNVTSIEGPGIERSTIDTTAHDSPDAWMEFIGSLINAGELTATVNYDPAAHDLLIADFEDTDARNYRLVWPPAVGGMWAFPAILTGFNPSAPVEEQLSAEVTYQIAGKPTLTPPA